MGDFFLMKKTDSNDIHNLNLLGRFVTRNP